MPVKPPLKGTTPVEIHTPPPRSTNGAPTRTDTAPRIVSGLTAPSSTRWPNAPEKTFADVNLDAITTAPTIVIRETLPHFVSGSAPARRSLDQYRVLSTARLPAADAAGLRMFKGRLFVDGVDGVLQVGLDREIGLYRAKLSSELKPSGPILVRDPNSKRWVALEEAGTLTWPLNLRRLRNLRVDLDFTGVDPGADGLHRFQGKLYAVIEHQAFQVLLDRDASSPTQNVWRIVNGKDPVAADTDNIYHASRPGESWAITRNTDNQWFSLPLGLPGGMHRNATQHLLMQRYVPLKNAYDALVASDASFTRMWRDLAGLERGSATETAALVAIEVHVRKHINMLTEYNQAYVKGKEWIGVLKSGGLYKEELHAQFRDRILNFNKLLLVMDRRVLPTLQTITPETCKKSIDHLNKKLKILEERQGVMEQMKKKFRDSDSEFEELNAGVPNADSVNRSLFNFYLRLYSDAPDILPDVGLQTFAALEFFVRDLKNVSPESRPGILRMALEQITVEKSQFELMLSNGAPAKAEYIRGMLNVIDAFELKIERKLSDIYHAFASNAELPSHDQDIDFDFIPPQPSDSNTPAAPRKVFRVRQHGTYKMLVGEKETAADGSVTVKIDDPFKPGQPPQRYEKRQGEWQPVSASPPLLSRAQLISEANNRLAEVDAQVDQARHDEAAGSPAANILEFLSAKADLLSQQAKRLENTEGTASDVDIAQLIQKLKTAADRMNSEGQSILLRMYKNKDVLDALRLNYLLDHQELNVIKTIDRELKGKGKKKSFLDVYSINDRVDNSPLWEAHFHYDRKDRPALDYAIKGANMKTLAQSRLGAEFQQQEELAGRPHQKIWRVVISPKIAQKLFDQAQ
ncbi:hypothetical protein GIW69_18485 [Pseudomonas syringae]|nr:hypothetical protein [Pseudomonas syringae]